MTCCHLMEETEVQLREAMDQIRDLERRLEGADSEDREPSKLGNS